MLHSLRVSDQILINVDRNFGIIFSHLDLRLRDIALGILFTQIPATPKSTSKAHKHGHSTNTRAERNPALDDIVLVFTVVLRHAANAPRF